MILFYFLKDFLMWTALKVFIESITVSLVLCVFFFLPQSMWGLSPPNQEGTRTPYIGKVEVLTTDYQGFKHDFKHL